MALLRTISGRVRSFQAIKNAVFHHGQRVAKKLHDRFNLRLPEHLKIDFWTLMQALMWPLERSCDTLLGAEHELVGERGNDKSKQRQRDNDGNALGSAILGFRTTFVGIYAPANVEEFGFPTVLGRTAFDRLRQGEFLVTMLEKQKQTLPAPRFTDGIDVDKELQGIRKLVEALRVSNAEAEAEIKAAQAAKVDKDRAADHWDGLFPWSGRILTGLFNLAGEHELARFIIPSSRRAGRTRVVAQEERLDEKSGSEAHSPPTPPREEDTGPGGPDEEAPGDKAPGDEAPGDEAPGDQVPGDEAPGDQVPRDRDSGDTTSEDSTS